MTSLAEIPTQRRIVKTLSVEPKTIKNLMKLIPRLRPTVASMIAALCSLSVGALISWPAPAVPNMNAQPYSLHLDAEETNWVVSLNTLAGVPGSLVSGWFMDRFGRKLGLMFFVFPTCVGWVLVMAAQNAIMIYAGRMICGFSAMAAMPMVGVYISEIAPPAERGLLMSLHELAVNTGVLLVYVIGAFVSWTWLAVLCSGIACLQGVLMPFVPESPRWLLMRGRKEEAMETLEWLHHGEVDGQAAVQAQMVEIELSVREMAACGQTPWLDYFRQPLLPALVLSQAMFVLQELCGINVLRSCTVSIFQAAGTDIDPNLATIVVGIVLLMGSLVFTCIVELLERRTYAIMASLMMATSLMALGAFFKLKECGLEWFAFRYLYWLPLLCMVVAALGYVFGVGPLPYVLTSEVFPTRARARASSFGVATLCFFAFLITKLFAEMTTAFGNSGAFWFCGCICIAGVVMSSLMIPKTKGKSLEGLHAKQQNNCPNSTTAC